MRTRKCKTENIPECIPEEKELFVAVSIDITGPIALLDIKRNDFLQLVVDIESGHTHKFPTKKNLEVAKLILKAILRF